MSAQVVRISSEVEVPYLTYQGQPVLTFAMIDSLHGRIEGTAKRNFSTNREYFVAGEDFHHVTDQSCLYEIRTSTPNVLSDAAREIMLITESGYLMLAKSFTDKLAWTVQRQLVKVYFRAKEIVANMEAAEVSGFSEELLTPAQQRELRELVYKIGCWFRKKGAGEWAAWATLRKHFNTQDSAYKIPSRRFGEAVDVLKAIEQASEDFCGRVNDAETNFFRRHFKCGPEIAMQIERGEKPPMFLLQ